VRDSTNWWTGKTGNTNLLAYSIDVCTADFVWPSNIILEVDFIAEVHLGRDGREDETLLSAVRQRKLYLPVESSGT